MLLYKAADCFFSQSAYFSANLYRNYLMIVLLALSI